jgi:cardiolipin synthase A/B
MTHTQTYPHEMRLLVGGVDLFAAMVQAMDAAQHEVLLETYIFDFAGAGADVAHALMRAAQRGIRVCVVVDGVGTGELPDVWAAQFALAGVQVRVFAPAVGQPLATFAPKTLRGRQGCGILWRHQHLG